MKKYVFAFFFFLISQLSQSQVACEWAVTYGSVPGVQYYVDDMVTDKAGNVYVYGIDFDTLGNDTGIIIKYDASGVQQWIKYDSLFSNYFGKIEVDKEGNVYIICAVSGFSFSADFMTVKFDSNGNTKWQKLYNGPADFTDVPTDVTVDDSLNVYVTGRSGGINTYYDFATIKYDSSGAEQWVARYDFSNNPGDLAYALVVDSLHNVYVTGQSLDTTNGSIVAVKYDVNGNQLWQKRVYGGVFSTPNCIAISQDGFIYVGGSDWAPGTSNYICIKYDTAGTEQWVARYDAQDTLPYTAYDFGRSLALDDSGNVFLTGSQFYGNGISDDFATVKFNKNGILEWVRTYNGGGGWDDAFSVLTDHYGNAYVFGQAQDTNPNFQMFTTIKYDGIGNTQWLATYPIIPQWSRHHAVSAGLDSLNNIYVSGDYSDLSVGQFLTVKYGVIAGFKENHISDKNVFLFPNPFHASSTLHLKLKVRTAKLKIYNTLGVMVRQEEISNSDSYTLSRGSLADGLYFYELRTNSSELIGTGKFIIN